MKNMYIKRNECANDGWIIRANKREYETHKNEKERFPYALSIKTGFLFQYLVSFETLDKALDAIIKAEGL